MTTLPPPVEMLADWLGESIDFNDARAVAVLSAVSNRAAGYTGQDWSATDAPNDVVDIVIEAAARKWLRPDPTLTAATVGAVSETYGDSGYFTDDEKAVLDRFRTVPSGLGVLATTRGQCAGTVYVPTAPEPSGYPFPWYASDDPAVFG